MVGQPVTGIGVSRLHFPVSTLGPGRRAGIWVQGCSIHCPGCLSRDTWSPASVTTDTAEIVDWIERVADDGLTGITVSGGEPLDQAAGLHSLLTRIRARSALADLDVLLYTGYSVGVLAKRCEPILTLVDAVISGPYLESRPSQHPWMGSGNQVLTLLTGRARDRFAVPPAEQQLQISADGGRLWMTGIPRKGDLARLEDLLARQGVRIGDLSWRP
jgi:anaerobic ribonucleoside-triphosphate reductase activating protein